MVTSVQASTQFDYSFLPEQHDLASELGGDPSAQLAAMVFLFSRERSKDAAFARDRLEDGIQAQQDIQIDKMHDSADAQFAAAVVQGLSKVAGGVAGLVSTGLDASAAQITNGTAAICGGVDGIIAGAFNSYSKDLDADAQAAANSADTGIRALETVQEDRTDAQDMKQRTLDFLGAIEDSKAEANKALVNIRV